jgi:hypothetical protein
MFKYEMNFLKLLTKSAGSLSQNKNQISVSKTKFLFYLSADIGSVSEIHSFEQCGKQTPCAAHLAH